MIAAVLALPAVGAITAGARAGLVYDTWYGFTNNWSNGGAWGSGVPNNAGTTTYWAVITQGTPTLDIDATVTALQLSSQAQVVGNNHTLTVTGSMDWGGGYWGYVNQSPTLHLDGAATLTMGPPAQGQSASARLLWGTIDSYGVANCTGGGNFYINSGAAFNNYGQFNLATANGIGNSYGIGDFVNKSGGVFNKNGTDAATVTPNFTNAGSVFVNAGTLQFEQVTNSSGGVISAAAGTTLVLHGTTSNYLAGSDLNGPGAIQFTYGTHNFDAGTFHPTGTVSIGVNSTVNVKNTITPSSVGTIAGTFNTDADQSFGDVTLTGGIGGQGTITFGENFAWTSGTMYKASSTANGHTAIPSGAQATIAPSGTSVTSYRILDNAGTITHTNGALYLNNGGALNNAGTYYANGGGGIATTFSPGTVNNSGGFDLITPGTFTVSVPFNNAASGVVNVDAGTLDLTGGGSNAGLMTVLAGATLKFDAAMTHVAGSGLTGAGALWFNSGINDLTNTAVATTGTLTVSSNATATFGNVLNVTGTIADAGTLVLNGSQANAGDQSFTDLSLSGTLGGSRNVIVSNHLDWSGTSSNMTGTGRTVIASGATADLSGFGKTIARALDNRGTINDAAQNVYVNAGASLNNSGTFNLTGAGSIASNNGVGAVNNSGTFNKNGTGTATVSIPLNNAASGVVNVNGGTLVLSGSGTHAGTINVATGSLLSLQANQTYAAGAQVTGAGGVEFTYGTSDMTSALLSTAGSFFVGTNGSVTLGNVIAPSGPVTVVGGLTMNRTAADAGEQAFDQLTVSGSFNGSRDVRVTGSFAWTGSSTVNGTGKLTLASGVVTNVDGTSKAIGRPVDNYGTVNHTAGTFNLNAGSLFTNYGTFNGTSPSGLTNNSGVGSFTNNGTFNKNGTGSYPISIPFNNGAGATLNINGGSVSLATGSDSGAINVAAGSTLTFSNTFTHNAGSVLSGAGAILFTGGTHVFPAGGFLPTGAVTFGNSSTVTVNNTFTPSSVGTIAGAVTFNADESFGDVTMAANVGGTGNLTLGGAFTWLSGAMTGSGTTTLPAGTTWAMLNNNTRYVSRNLDSSAAATLSSGSLFLTNGVTLTNRGTFDASTTGLSAQTGGGTLANVGTFNKNGTSTFTLPSGVVLNNTGTVNVNQGILQLSGGGTNAGTINVGPAGALQIDGNAITFAPGSSVVGTGAVNFAGSASVFPAGTYAATGPLTVASGASATFNGAIAPSSISPLAGTLVVNANEMFGDLTVNSNGTLGGSGDFLFTGRLSFNGGTLAGTGKTTFQVGSTLDLAANATRSLYRPLQTGGSVNFSAGTLTMYGTTWQVSSGLQVSGSNFLSIGAGGGTTNNVLYATGGINLNMNPGGELSIGSGVTLNNNSSVNVYGGRLSLNTQPAQLNAAGTLIGGNWAVGNAGNLNFAVGPNVTTIGANATVTLDGAGSKFDKLNALTRNDGSLTFSTGRAFTATAALNNTGFVTVSGNAALTTAALTNSGQITVTSGGTLTTNGAITSTGTLAIAAGSTMTVANGLTQTGGSLVIEGMVNHTGGTSTISPTTSQAWWDGSALNVTGGTLTLASDAGAIYPNPYLTISVSGTGTARMTSATQRLKSLSVSTGGNAILPTGSQETLFTRSLDLTGTGKLDLTDNKLAVDDLADGHPTLNFLRQFLSAGSLFSSTANVDPQHRLGIGYADASDLGVSTWGVMPVFYGGMTLAKVTWLGDANLDGKINADDYVLLDRAYARSVTNAHWTDGDFNYDGQITSADYLVIDRVVMQQSGTLSPSFLAQREAQFGPIYVTELLAAVPEPTSACVLLLALPLAGRRRRK